MMILMKIGNYKGLNWKWMVLITHLKICRLRDVNETVDLFFFFSYFSKANVYRHVL